MDGGGGMFKRGWSSDDESINVEANHQPSKEGDDWKRKLHL